ncbi:OmpA family protein [Lacibacter sp. MH-610]|uniref:OmpA family protein n=1 Tax=Lacibacter sp. MH-610 TaxID=3020883 RepID=UPI00389217E4
MQRNLIIILLVTIAPFLVQAQNGSGLLNKIKNKVNNRVDKKIDGEIDKTLDKIEGKEQTTANNSKTSEASSVNNGLQSFAKYDFIPGEQVIYSNDFAADAMGELPVGWNSNGTGAVVTINGLAGKWAQLNQNSAYLTDNKDSLTENFTVEFDLVLRRTNPKAPFPMLVFGVLASGTYEPAANELLKDYTYTFATELKVQPYDNNASHMHLHTYNERKKYLTTDIKKFGVLEQYFNKVIHVAMQVQKERLRIWFNETKLYDLPKAIVAGSIINQLYFDVKRYGGADAEVGYAIGNIKMAKGLPDTRHKLIEEGTFSTTGILFDVNTATIKPESSGVLKEIADVLQQHAQLRVKIIGHTDSDGSDASNLELSKKRAEAVMQALIKNYGIDRSRLESDGKGESVPVGDNKTKEGKAQNRRVEFIKQ